MGLNKNSKEPGKIKDNEVHDGQNSIAPDQIGFSPGSPNDHSTFSSTSSSLRINSNSLESVTSDKLHPSNNIVTITNCPLQKKTIRERELNLMELNLIMKDQKIYIPIIIWRKIHSILLRHEIIA